MADEVKQVKVDNWGIYFLQRLKHFFNRTDYCDLTLQFQDNAQLKVHRLVLSACTEYFELLERTCEMYEDCLVMPEDLQADIVVPIVNFMYTGQLEFKMDLLERLYQCSEIMNMPVLTKLLDSHRPKVKNYNYTMQSMPKPSKRTNKIVKEDIKTVSNSEVVKTTLLKRYYEKSPTVMTTVYRDKKVYLPINKPNNPKNRAPSPLPLDNTRYTKKVVPGDPRPTRYELPEELDTDNIFENSFSNISYASEPLMVHPETRKQYAKRPKLSNEPSTSSFGGSVVDIVPYVEPKKQEDSLFEDSVLQDESTQMLTSTPGPSRDMSQLFDQIMDKPNPRVKIDTTTVKSANLDHAKIISEVLKKYPHLVNSNKNIKLKILNTPSKSANVKKQISQKAPIAVPKPIKVEKDDNFETEVLDSIQAAKLIALGVENVEGPWICLICGTPGKAMNFSTYYKFRRHLVEVHKEKPVLTMCEYCGLKSMKRNYLLYHLLTKHDVEPPPSYNFPRCNQCSYIALSEALLNKHKLNHSTNKKFRCNVCPSTFHSSNQLLAHIQSTGHKYTEKKPNYQCIYCQRAFMREANLCAHLRTQHRAESIMDGIIEDSEEEMMEEQRQHSLVKSEPNSNSNDYQEIDVQYQIHQKPDGNINIVTKTSSDSSSSSKQTILNTGVPSQGLAVLSHKNKTPKKPQTVKNFYLPDTSITTETGHQEEIVMFDNTEYIMKDNTLIPRKSVNTTEEYILSDPLGTVDHTPSMECENIQNANVKTHIQHSNVILKNQESLPESIPIYVSNEEEYKAIMSGNQPIIFDSGDSNKTLTVLTAPHASSLDNASINLTNTQPNDMMIIQGNYPINVTNETPGADNQNIVVVYSHAIDGQNKQFQLITTQGLEGQFVQSSATITQNFETITTTAPVIAANELEKQNSEVWHGNIEQLVDTDQIAITPIPTSQVAHPVLEQSTQPDPGSSHHNITITEIPQIPQDVVATANEQLATVDQNHDNTVTDASMASDIGESNEVICENNSQTMETMEICEEIPNDEHVVETTDNIQITDNVDQHEVVRKEIDTMDTSHDEDASLMESQTYTQPENLPEVAYSQTNANIAENPNNEVTHIENVLESNDEQLIDTTDAGMVSNSGLLVNDMPKPGSEWAEGQIHEVIEETPGEVVLENENSHQQNSVESCELEESIENIQQEVEKQIATTPADDTEEANDADTSQDEQEYVDNGADTNMGPAESHEKISSLLNDWADNDSQEGDNELQEDNESTNESAPPDVSSEDVASLATEETEMPQKKENIKSLVSDWDEEDEDNK